LEDFKTNERYAKIVEDSRNLFLKYGYKSMTMDDVARELGVSKKRSTSL
jgi:AcrR family transcriptional regulator